MKLIFCTACRDIVALKLTRRTCRCGQSGGLYLADGWHAEISGPCLAVGIDNQDFCRAVGEQLAFGDLEEGRDGEPLGRDFQAWIMPEGAPRVHRKVKSDD